MTRASLVLVALWQAASVVAGSTQQGPSIPSSQAGMVCAGPDATSRAQIIRIGSLVSSPDTFNATFRDSLKIVKVRPGEIALVAEPTICHRAVRALDSLENRSVPGGKVYVYRIGPQYLVERAENYDSLDHHWAGFFDRKWRYLSGLWW